MAGHHAESTLKSINKNRQNDEYCDFAIKVKGKSFKVHRLILDSCSPYFRAMFASQMQEARQGFVDVKNVDEDVVQQCIDFIYTGKAIPNMAMIEGMIELASMWQLDKLNERCKAFLAKSIGFESCFRIKHIATLHQFEVVERECDTFVLDNIEGLVDKGNFCDLKKEYLVQYLQNVKPIQESGLPKAPVIYSRAQAKVMWKLFHGWQLACSERSVDTFCEILQLLPIKYCQPSLIEQEVWKNTHVSICDNCKAHVATKLLENCAPRRNLLSSLFRNPKVSHEEHQIDEKNCLFLKSLSKVYNNRKVEKWVDSFIISNFCEIVKRPEFNNLDKSDLEKYISSARFNDSTIPIIWTAVVDWVKHDLANREDDFPAIFEIIDFSNASCDFLQNTVCREPLLQNSTTCKDFLMGHLLSKVGKLENKTSLLEKRIDALEKSRKA